MISLSPIPVSFFATIHFPPSLPGSAFPLACRSVAHDRSPFLSDYDPISLIYLNTYMRIIM
jgi:hypothetical protein